MSSIFILFLVSIPIFYIIGIVSVLSGSTKKETNSVTQSDLRTSSHHQLQYIVNYIENILKTSPNTTGNELLQICKNDLTQNQPELTVPLLSNSVSKNINIETKTSKINNWYSTDSINLLLYIGAFLIIAAGIFFMSFQWTSISGIGKAIIFSLFSLMFLILGFWWEKLPKIKSAGIVFISIGAVLTPLSGIAWYNFVCKPEGIPIGITWLLTSLFTISLYSLLLNRFKTVICSYALNLAIFSSVLSLVNLGQLDTNIYLLASLTYALVVFIISRFLSTRLPPQLMVNSLSTSANIVVPTVLFYCITFGLKNLSTLEAAYCFILGAVFYGSVYYFYKKIWQLMLVLILIPLSLLSFFGWLELATITQIIYFSIIAFIYAISSIFVNNKYLEEKKLVLLLGFCLNIILIFWSQFNEVSSLTFSILIFMPGITSLIAAFSFKQPFISIITSLSGMWSIYIYVQQALNLNSDSQQNVLSITFTIIACALFFLSEQFPKSIQWCQSLLFSFTFFAISGIFSSISQTNGQLTIIWIITILIARIAWRYQYKLIVYLSLALFTWGIIIMFNLINVPESISPLIYTIFAITLYGFSFYFPEFYKEQTKLWSLILTIIFPLIMQFSYQTEKFSLISFYLTTSIYIIESILSRKTSIAYLTSALVMITYLWQIKYLNIDETLVYSIPIGTYFMALAHHRRLHNDFNNSQILDLIGSLSLLVTPFILSFGDRAIFYSLSLGGVGIILVLLGIAINQKNIMNTGFAGIILSVLPQTFQYALTLPKFILVGLVGLIFLILAIYLLWKSSSQEPPKNNSL